MADAPNASSSSRRAGLRDHLKALAHITARQGINVSWVDDADVVALA